MTVETWIDTLQDYFKMSMGFPTTGGTPPPEKTEK